jgi:penicillin-binding protein-related factor A (putative recombinase)
VSFTVKGQYAIEPAKDYSHDIGNMVEMLDNLKARIEYLVKDINQEQTDFLIDYNANRIGAIIYHLAATEAYYQAYTLKKENLIKTKKKNGRSH